MKMFAVFLLLLYASQDVLTVKVEVDDWEPSVVLPCQYNQRLEDIATVKWSRLDLNPNIVHQRQEGDDLRGQNELFKERTSMRLEALDSGDFSLTLSEPQVSDSGVYICSLDQETEEIMVSDVQLNVTEKFPTWAKVLLVLLVLLAVSGGLLFHFRHYFMSVYRVEVDSGEESVLLPFKTAVRLPERVRVEWTEKTGRIVHRHQGESNSLLRTEQQLWRYEDRTELKPKFKSGDLSLILKNPTNRDTGTYTCTVYRRDKVLAMKQVVLNVKGGGSSATCDSFIVAIDLGTSYSGYAFSLTTREEKIDPMLPRWGKEHGFDTPKTPTCILFNEDETFLSFGYEAKITYKEMSREEAKKHYLFEDFKMALYSKKLSSNLEIKAANGKSMKALKVFSESLRFFKEEALRTISRNTEGKIFPSDFTWVLTVPAIWDLSAKQFMREAAMQAGIITEGDEGKLVITLEPEAASIWCKKLPSEGFISEKHKEESLDQSAGTQYIVVDCGGGTIDITVHEVLGGGALKERHKASGNNLGGQTVDRKFKQFLREIFPEGVWDEFEQNFPNGAQKIMYDFTYLKQVEKDVQISCPVALGKLAKDKSGTENFVKSELGASWDGEFIKISRDKMRSFYDESLQGITENLQEIFTCGLNIKYILLVGGYAQSKVLQQHITDQFGHRCKVLCPFRAQEAILRGAVEFGRNPNVVASRKSSYTYGFAVCEKFDENKHKKEKKFTAKGGEWSRDIFRKLVEEGEDLGSEETREFLCSPTRAGQVEMRLRFFRSVRKHPVYVDDWGVEEVGSFIVDMTGGGKVKLEIDFGSTEITATGTNLKSGKKQKVKIDFMTTDMECVIDGDDEDDDASVGSSTQSEERILDGAEEDDDDVSVGTEQSGPIEGAD